MWMTVQTGIFPLPPGEYKHLTRKNKCSLTVRKSFFWVGPLGLNLAHCVDFAQAAVSATSKSSRGGYEEFDTKGEERMPRSTEAFS